MGWAGSFCIRRQTTSAKLLAILPIEPEIAAIKASVGADGPCVGVVEAVLMCS